MMRGSPSARRPSPLWSRKRSTRDELNCPVRAEFCTTDAADVQNMVRMPSAPGIGEHRAYSAVVPRPGPETHAIPVGMPVLQGCDDVEAALSSFLKRRSSITSAGGSDSSRSDTLSEYDLEADLGMLEREVNELQVSAALF